MERFVNSVIKHGNNTAVVYANFQYTCTEMWIQCQYENFVFSCLENNYFDLYI